MKDIKRHILVCNSKKGNRHNVYYCDPQSKAKRLIGIFELHEEAVEYAELKSKKDGVDLEIHQNLIVTIVADK